MASPNDVFGLTEKIEGFTFREKGGVKILKKWRKEAVIMQVDIEIVSVSRSQFLNFGSLPPSGFYGYASLIMRDFSLPSIAITQPRQTLYYAVNDFAQSAWMQFHNMVRIQENSQGIEQLICFNTGLLGGACVAKPCKPIPQPSFIEFPLREILINTYFGTQFKIELSYWKINDILDNCGNIVAPISNQSDGDKDVGLPPFGVMPNQASDSANPYDGLPPISPFDREGVIELSRLNDLGKPNPDNIPPELEDIPATSTTDGWYIEMSVVLCSDEIRNPPARVGTLVYSHPCYSDSFIDVTSVVARNSVGCSDTGYTTKWYRIFSPTNGTTHTTDVPAYGALNGVIKRGLLPSGSTFN